MNRITRVLMVVFTILFVYSLTCSFVFAGKPSSQPSANSDKDRKQDRDDDCDPTTDPIRDRLGGNGSITGLAGKPSSQPSTNSDKDRKQDRDNDCDPTTDPIRDRLGKDDLTTSKGLIMGKSKKNILLAGASNTISTEESLLMAFDNLVVDLLPFGNIAADVIIQITGDIRKNDVLTPSGNYNLNAKIRDASVIITIVPILAGIGQFTIEVDVQYGMISAHTEGDEQPFSLADVFFKAKTLTFTDIPPIFPENTIIDVVLKIQDGVVQFVKLSDPGLFGLQASPAPSRIMKIQSTTFGKIKTGR